MATVVDKARPAAAPQACAMKTFTQPTPRVMDHGFSLKQSVVDTHVPNLSVDPTPVDNTGDGAGTPIVNDTTPPFFHPSVPVEGVAPELNRVVMTATVDPANPLKWHFKSYGGVEPITYDFGDGLTHTPSDGRNTAHTYAEPGDYHITAEDAADHIDEGDITVSGA